MVTILGTEKEKEHIKTCVLFPARRVTKASDRLTCPDAALKEQEGAAAESP